MEIKTGLVIAHLIGLALGVGGATLMDLILVRFVLRGTIAREHADILKFSSMLVSAGLLILWVTGIAFLAHYYVFNAAALGNPKIFAKVVIVAILTVNGILIHNQVLPIIERNVGRRLFDGVSPRLKMGMLAAGAVSATSWYVPLALGALREFNFVVPASQILLAYAALLMTAVLSAQILGHLLTQQERNLLRRRSVKSRV
jgi:hypothetical protein